jgi:hypothetical protein
VDDDLKQMAERIDHDMALTPFDFLASIGSWQTAGGNPNAGQGALGQAGRPGCLFP